MMNKFMKRAILPVFIVAVLVSGFTGCAENVADEYIPEECEVEESSEENYGEAEGNIITMDGLREEYMMSIGNGYEDALVIDLSKRYEGEVAIYDPSDLTLDMLENRNGQVIIERCYGVVIDAENGAGRVLNPYDEDYDYISYSRCEGIREGTLMMTYLVYDPDTNYYDDIMERYDCVVSHELEG